jgi:hypothetical protein
MSMPSFPVSELIYPTIVIVVAGFALSFMFTRRALLSLCIAGVKGALFLLYFGIFFDGTYTFRDDWKYLRIGELLTTQHVGILNLFSDHAYLLHTTKSENLSYYVYNATAVRLFDFGYYAPVALNILLTFLAAGFLMKTVQAGLGMSRRASIGLFAFVALSPAILAWSTIANLKDILVATATTAVVYAVALADRGNSLRALCFAAAGVLVLIVTRFYVPLMLGAAFGITLFLSHRGRRSPWTWLMAIVALAAVVRVLGHGSLIGALHELRANIGNPVTGILRFIITPIPFHTEPNYAFLDIPQLLYWLLLPLQAYGIMCVWRKATMTGRFMVIYFFLMTMLYGAFTTLQGPRHRIQIDGIIVIFEYYGILAFVRHRFASKRHPGHIHAIASQALERHPGALYRRSEGGA